MDTATPEPVPPPKKLTLAVERSRDHLLSRQYLEGYWVDELESNATMVAEYVFFLWFMGLHNDPAPREKSKNYLLKHQQADGGWSLYYGGPSDISVTVEAYIALKMTGLPMDAPEMVQARQCIEAKGGVRSARVFTKIFLAMMGQTSWEFVPAMPVEVILLPNWFYFNIYEMSSWSRGTVVPLTLIYSQQPVWPLPPNHSVPELFTEADPDLSVRSPQPGLNWGNAFLTIDKILKFVGRSPWKPLRRIAMRRALQWILDHQEPEGDFSGIQPAMLNSLLALKVLGYENNSSEVSKGLEAIDRFIIDRGDHLVFQACVSPLWDTALALNALMDAGIPEEDPALMKAAEWMLKKQVTRPGDWTIKNPNTPPGGWAFEFYNERYPDTDDTAEILMALHRIPFADPAWKEKECQRALTWLLSMQSQNGGWGAFDMDNDHDLFNQIPFADHGAMLDPPTVDVTGRVLWLMGRLHTDRNHPQIQKALKFIRAEQEADGCWFGRWGVNYIYGTWLVLCGLQSVGEDMDQPYLRKAVDWMKAHQNEDGGWGETCASYLNPKLRGQGTSTASQTAWAVMALVEAGEAHSPEAQRGVDFLIRTQQDDGSWHEDHFTGTGFPGHFFIKYHLYSQFFPLMALARYRHHLEHGHLPPRRSAEANRA